MNMCALESVCVCVTGCVCVVAYLHAHTEFPINPRFMVMVGARKKKAFSFPK